MPPSTRDATDRAAGRSPTRSCAEGFLELGPESRRTFRRLALEFRELLEQALLLRVQPFGRPDVHPDDEVALGALPQHRKAAPPQPDDRFRLRAGSDADLLL